MCVLAASYRWRSINQLLQGITPALDILAQQLALVMHVPWAIRQGKVRPDAALLARRERLRAVAHTLFATPLPAGIAGRLNAAFNEFY